MRAPIISMLPGSQVGGDHINAGIYKFHCSWEDLDVDDLIKLDIFGSGGEALIEFIQILLLFGSRDEDTQSYVL